MSKQLKITLFRGFAGKTKRQIAVAQALGLRKREQTVIHNDTPTIRGMINKIPHMLIVEEIEE